MSFSGWSSPESAGKKGFEVAGGQRHLVVHLRVGDEFELFKNVAQLVRCQVDANKSGCGCVWKKIRRSGTVEVVVDGSSVSYITALGIPIVHSHIHVFYVTCILERLCYKCGAEFADSSVSLCCLLVQARKRCVTC